MKMDGAKPGGSWNAQMGDGEGGRREAEGGRREGAEVFFCLLAPPSVRPLRLPAPARPVGVLWIWLPARALSCSRRTASYRGLSCCSRGSAARKRARSTRSLLASTVGATGRVEARTIKSKAQIPDAVSSDFNCSLRISRILHLAVPFVVLVRASLL